jgi:hypothetical protein
LATANASDSGPIRLSFGRVLPDQVIEQVIGFQNPTDRLLEIENIQLTPPLLAKEFTPVILPGMDGSFKLVLGENRPLGEFEGQIVVNFKGAVHAPLIFEITGFIIPPIEFQPYPAFFVATHAGENKTASIEILNHRDEPLFLKSAESHSKRFTTQLETLEAGQHYRLSLLLDGTAEPGAKTEDIILQADPPLDKPLMVKANTKIRERVYHFPDSVDMGALPIKVASDANAVQTLAQTLMAYRPGTNDFTVTASINLDYIALISERGPQGDRYQLTLTLIPGKVKPGPIEGTVRIETNDEKFKVLEVPVSGYILE